MFTALQLLGLGAVAAGLIIAAGVAGAFIGFGVVAIYVGAAAERDR